MFLNRSSDKYVRHATTETPFQTFGKTIGANCFSTNNSHRMTNFGATKIYVLRIVLMVCLALAAIGCGIVSYFQVHDKEYKLFEDHYNSLTEQTLLGVRQNMDRVHDEINSIAVAFSFMAPNSNSWPSVAMPGFTEMFDILAQSSATDNFVFSPLVRPDQQESFEIFMDDYFDSRPILNSSNRMFRGGIWTIDFSNNYQPVRHTGGVSNSDKQILVPFLQFTAERSYDFLGGIDLHTNTELAPAIDRVIDCTNDALLATTAASSPGADVDVQHCLSISDVIPFPVQYIPNPPPIMDYQAMIFAPIVVTNSTSGLKEIVGLSSRTVSWGVLLSRVLPSYVSGLDVVVDTGTIKFTYRIIDGVPVYAGVGDLHDSNFEEYVKSENIRGGGVTPSGASYESSLVYTMSIYPRQDLYESYITDTPITMALTFAGGIIFCLIVFICYDTLLSHESMRKNAVLDTKRRYVRFISHEVRTPLNTMRIGLSLFSTEIRKISSTMDSNPPLTDLPNLVNKFTKFSEELVNDMSDNTESAINVLNDLLSYDKIEMGKLKLEFVEVDVLDLVRKAMIEVKNEASSKNVEFDFVRGHAPSGGAQEDAEGNVTLLGDDGRLKQVLRNIISNAVKFSSNDSRVVISVEWVLGEKLLHNHSSLGSGHLKNESLQLLKEKEIKGYVKLSVKDSGVGMDVGQLADIGEDGIPFNENELTGQQGGGLGLYICRRIVWHHGGQLYLHSDGIGMGTTCSCELPLFERNSSSSSSVSSRNSNKDSSSVDWVAAGSGGDGGANANGGGGSSSGSRADMSSIPTSIKSPHSSDKTAPAPNREEKEDGEDMGDVSATLKHLLVVDDSFVTRKMMCKLFESKQYVCSQAGDGQQTLDVYQTLMDEGRLPDAILMDYEMPVMNGPTATKELRRRGCKVLIIGVSGNVLPDDVAFFKQQGADAFLPKPLTMADFEAEAKKYIRSKQKSTPTITRRKSSLLLGGGGSTVSNRGRLTSHGTGLTAVASQQSIRSFSGGGAGTGGSGVDNPGGGTNHTNAAHSPADFPQPGRRGSVMSLTAASRESSFGPMSDRIFAMLPHSLRHSFLSNDVANNNDNINNCESMATELSSNNTSSRHISARYADKVVVPLNEVV